MNTKSLNAAICITLVSLLGMTAANAGSDHGMDSNLPETLNQYYPPASPAPVYLLTMLDMARPLSGMVSDALTGDWSNAQKGFEVFRTKYIEASEMVPEWKEMYPTAPLEELGSGVAAGDLSKVMPAVEKMGGACHSCHLATMAPAQLKYRWGSFGEIGMTDPLSGQDVGFAQFKQMLQTSLAGIGTDLAQGQLKAATVQAAGFGARFQALKESCVACHDSERKYYVDESITDKITALQHELSKPDVEMNVVGGLLDSIGRESCSKCHLVHIPAAYAASVSATHLK